jgi:hypothetical protein
MENARIGIVESALYFFKPNSMLGAIGPVFALVSSESEHV